MNKPTVAKEMKIRCEELVILKQELQRAKG